MPKMAKRIDRSSEERLALQALARSRTGESRCVERAKTVLGCWDGGTVSAVARSLVVATGAIHAKTTAQKRRVEFLEFMDGLLADLPMANDVKGSPGERELHVILDNYCIHKRNDAWLALHPNVHFHFTPTSASWLNLVEVWFGILSRKALRGGSFKSIEELRAAIEAFIAAYGPRAKPFVWRKREVAGTQLRNTIVNLCN